MDPSSKQLGEYAIVISLMPLAGELATASGCGPPLLARCVGDCHVVALAVMSLTAPQGQHLCLHNGIHKYTVACRHQSIVYTGYCSQQYLCSQLP